MLEKPAKHQNPHKTKTLKNIKQNMKNTENVFRNGKKEEESNNQKKGIKGKIAKNETEIEKKQPSPIYEHFLLV